MFTLATIRFKFCSPANVTDNVVRLAAVSVRLSWVSRYLRLFNTTSNPELEETIETDVRILAF